MRTAISVSQLHQAHLSSEMALSAARTSMLAEAAIVLGCALPQVKKGIESSSNPMTETRYFTGWDTREVVLR